MDPGLVTLIMFGAMLLLLVTGLPVAFVLGAVALGASLFLWGANSLGILAYSVVTVQNMYALMCIPGFIFTGVLLEHCGIAEEMFEAVYKWLGGIRGGLAVGVVGICVIFGAIVGVSAAATITMGYIALPAMLRRKYQPELSIGTIQAGGALGILIPPSVTFAFYGVIAEQSIGKLFASGIFPGLLLATLYVVYILVRSHFQPKLAPAIPREERPSWRERFLSLRIVIWPIFLVFVVLGLILLGVTTPTEASAVGAVGALIVAWAHKRLSWKVLTGALKTTMIMSGFAMWIVVAALAFAAIYSGLGAIKMLEGVLGGANLSPTLVVVSMLAIWFVLGCFIDSSSILFITAPLFIPLVASLGYDLIWFGCLFVMATESGLLTPPFGFNLFNMKAVVESPQFPFRGQITLEHIYKSVWPYIILQNIGLALVIIFPQIALWLPSRGFTL